MKWWEVGGCSPKEVRNDLINRMWKKGITQWLEVEAPCLACQVKVEIKITTTTIISIIKLTPTKTIIIIIMIRKTHQNKRKLLVILEIGKLH